MLNLEDGISIAERVAIWQAHTEFSYYPRRTMQLSGPLDRESELQEHETYARERVSR